MSCDMCRRFSLATAHIGSIQGSVVAESTSKITEFEVHNKDEEENLCLTFKLNDVAHRVVHDETGFAVLRTDAIPYHFIRWGCKKCGIVLSGTPDNTFSPFATYRLEMVRNLDVVANYPVNASSTQLLHINLPNEFMQEMLIKSFGTLIEVKGQCLNTQVIAGELTPMLLLYVPMFVQMTTTPVIAPIVLQNIISLQNGQMSIIMCSYNGAATSFYIHKVDGIFELYMVSDNVDALIKIDTMNEYTLCHMEGKINGAEVDASFIRSGSECTPFDSCMYPPIRWTFVGRTIHAVMLE